MKTSGRQHLTVALVGGAIALIAGVGGLRFWQSERSSTPSDTLEVALPARVAVAALGRLEPRGEVIRVSGPRDERIGLLEVTQGDWVEAGAVLAYLENHTERLAERDLAASQLAEAENRLVAETDLGQAEVSEAMTRLQQIDRPATFEIEGQQASVRQLEAELSLEQEDLERFQALFAEGAISEQELDRQQSTVDQVQERLSNARSALVRLEAAKETDMLNAEAHLRAAEANLKLSRIEVAVDSARRNLALAEARLERTIIRAPQTGRILQIYTRAGEAILADDGILDLGDTSQMFVVAEVYETDVSLVQVGQPATIVSRNGAFTQELTGTVAEVGWQIFKNDVLDDDPAANADARVVEVKIRLDNSQLVAGLTNLQVDVRIDIEATSSIGEMPPENLTSSTTDPSPAERVLAFSNSVTAADL